MIIYTNAPFLSTVFLNFFKKLKNIHDLHISHLFQSATTTSHRSATGRYRPPSRPQSQTLGVIGRAGRHCGAKGIEKEGRNYEPGTGAGKWDGSRFPVPILRRSSALFFSPAAPQCLRARPMTPEVVPPSIKPSESRSAHTDYLRSFSAKYHRD